MEEHNLCMQKTQVQPAQSMQRAGKISFVSNIEEPLVISKIYQYHEVCYVALMFNETSRDLFKYKIQENFIKKSKIIKNHINLENPNHALRVTFPKTILPIISSYFP